MAEIEKINNTDLTVKVYQGQRVVTFKDIDTVHERPEGTARKRFNDNKKHFIEGEDFFALDQPSEIRTLGIERPQGGTPDKVLLITESGYLMLVKSFTDDLAWSVQRQLVKSYFRKQTGHHVEKLTVTSRDIAIMANMKSKHHFVLNAIRDIIVELETLGFDSEEFFTESTYMGGNNQPREQFTFPGIGSPNMALINHLIKRRKQGNKVVLWTCRVGDRLKEAVEWCRQYGLDFDAVNKNLPEMIEWYGNDTRKVCADVYIDDKAVNKPKYHVPYKEVAE